MSKRWVDKYRPTKADDYIFPKGKAGDVLRRVLDSVSPPHLILNGTPGTGKTTFVSVLADRFGIDDIDVSRRMGSDISCSSDIRQLVYPFVRTMPLNSRFKILHVEEADHMNKRATTDMKSVLEDYERVVVVLTTNNIDTIDAAILSRCLVVEMKQTRKNMTELVERILAAENRECDKKELASILRGLPCDLRSAVNAVQNNL